MYVSQIQIFSSHIILKNSLILNLGLISFDFTHRKFLISHRVSHLRWVFFALRCLNVVRLGQKENLMSTSSNYFIAFLFKYICVWTSDISFRNCDNEICNQISFYIVLRMHETKLCFHFKFIYTNFIYQFYSISI